MTHRQETRAPAPDRLGGQGGGRSGMAAGYQPSPSLSLAVVRRYAADLAAASKALADLALADPPTREGVGHAP